MEDWQDRLWGLLEEAEKKRRKGKAVQLLNEFKNLDTLDILLQRPSQLLQKKYWKLEELTEGYDETIGFLHIGRGTDRSLGAMEAFEMVKDAVPG